MNQPSGEGKQCSSVQSDSLQGSREGDLCAAAVEGEQGTSINIYWAALFSIRCFSALPLYTALPCNSFVLIPVHCQARNPVSGSDLCWQGWGRSWKPFSPWVFSTHSREEINSFWNISSLQKGHQSPGEDELMGVHQGSVVTWEGPLPAKILPKNS